MRKIVRTKTDNGVTFTVGNSSISVRVDELPESIYNALVVHGLNAKVGDSVSDAKKRGLTDAGILAELKATIDQLKRGVFNSTRTASGGSILAQAVAEVMGKTLAEAATYLGLLDEDNLKKVQKHPKVIAAVLRIKADLAAKAAEGADEDDDDLPEV